MSLLVHGATARAHGEAAYATDGDDRVAIGIIDHGKFLPKRQIVAD